MNTPAGKRLLQTLESCRQLKRMVTKEVDMLRDGRYPAGCKAAMSNCVSVKIPWDMIRWRGLG
jgi:hypothetical protein